MEEVVQARQKVHAPRTVVGKRDHRYYTIMPYSPTPSEQFNHKGDNFPLNGFREPHYTTGKGTRRNIPSVA